MTAYERLLDRLREGGRLVRQRGTSRASAQCPGHNDRDPSLTVTAIEGQTLIHCHAGCSPEQVMATIGWTIRDLYDDPRGARYDYTDAAGSVTRTVRRTPDKRFHQEGQTRGPSTLFRLPQVIKAVEAGAPVYIVEGEKDVLAVESLGGVGTTAPMGAANWGKVDASPLHGADLRIVPDRDHAGERWAADVAASVNGSARSTVILRSVTGKDIADHIAAGHTLDQLEVVDDNEDPYAATRRFFPRLDLAALLASTRPPREWVIYGLIPAGASVSLVAPAGSGKSLLVLAMAVTVARGDRTFAGIPVSRRRVLLVDMENTEDDLADRLTALGITVDNVTELDHLVILHLPQLKPLDTLDGAQELLAAVAAYSLQPGDIVCLDSLQRVIKGPENDSDTLRAFYRCTAAQLKQRGLTLLRTDNTGKDHERGARGTSGKQDDVDLELRIIRDAEYPDLIRVTPGKARLPGIEPVTIRRHLDPDGILLYSTSGDAFREDVATALRNLDGLGVPVEAGQRPAEDALKAAGLYPNRKVVRVAVAERKMAARTAPNSVAHPSTPSTPPTAPTEPGAPRRTPSETHESTPEGCADPLRRTTARHPAPAPADGAPPPTPYKGGRTGAHTPSDETCCGERFPGVLGEPLVLACGLCANSPTYWRKESGTTSTAPLLLPPASTRDGADENP